MPDCLAIRRAVWERACREGWCVSEQFWDVVKALDMLNRPQLFHDIQATAVWVLVALRSLYNRARMFVAHFWFLTHTGVRQGDDSGTGLFRRSYDAGVGEWHEELDQHQWAQRLTCIHESDTLSAHAVLLATGGYADDLARTSIACSYKKTQRH